MCSPHVECWGSAAKLREEESWSVLLEKYVRKQPIILPGKVIRAEWLKSSSLDKNIKSKLQWSK